jgi:periplasmic protein TonB
MPRDLFGDVTRPSISIGNRKWYTVPVSLLSHSIIIAMFVVLPILAAPYMPDVMARAMPDYIKIVDPPKPPPIKAKQPDLKPPPDPDAFPTSIPDGVTKEPEVLRDPPNTGTPGGLIDAGTIDDVLPPPPVVAKPPEPQKPLPVGGTIRRPTKIGGADPIYPAIAQAARIQGIVIIEATIAADGHVMNARVLRSVPMLEAAALDAVRTWEYTPTLLNGAPVPVIMTVTVTFTLSK